MIRRIIPALFMLILWLSSPRLFAQENKSLLITGNFEGVSFETFVQKAEAQTDYRFYFKQADVDSIIVNITVTDAHLPAILDRLFAHSALQYAIDGEDHVFITKGFAISTTLPNGFFEGKADTTAILAQRKNNGPAFVYTKPVVSQISIENKLYEIGFKVNYSPKGKANMAGYVKDESTGETLSGASIYVEDAGVHTTTDQFGYYSLILPAGRHTLYIKAMGMTDAKRQIMLYSEGRFNISMGERVMRLKEVVIESEKEKNVRSTMMGTQKLDILSIKQTPTAFGEADVLRAVLSLPGVKSVGEASTGMNVRGGASDENLILFNGAEIFNPSHLFGFFSAFDPDLVKDVTLYKGNIPAKYGGRISSVLDITSLDGNDKKIGGTAGLGPLTSKLMLNGPLFKGKTTFVLGARTTYSNWIFRSLPAEYYKSRAAFQDLTLHVSQKLGQKDNLYLNGYLSGDKFNLNNDTTYQYHNKNANIKWKHTFNNRFYGVFTAGYDHYDYQVSSSDNPVNAYKLMYAINQFKALADFSYFLSNKHTLTFGFSSIYYRIMPGSFSPNSKTSLIIPDTLEKEQALESAVYLSDHYEPSSNLSLDAGIRYSYYDYLGPKNVFTYAPGVPRQENNILGTTYYPANKVIKTYGGPEYRIAARYALSANTSLKASFNSLRQYLHMISNSTTMSPTDVWKLSDPYIEPQQGEQVSLGWYRNFKSNTIETSAEVYYKWYDHYLDYKSGAILTMNHHIETDVINTVGKAYGIELFVKKETGKLNGWVSYTYSRALLQQDDPLAGEKINEGREYPGNFDQPHNFTLIGNYRLSHRFSVSLNVVYSTGRPITLPIGEYNYAGSERVLYSDRNEYRIPDYFRTDFSMNIEGNHKVKQLTHNSWTLGVYNWLGRKNAYSVYFIAQNGYIQGYKLSIFGSAIPFVTYNVRF